MYGNEIENTNLTVINANIGAANAHMAPFLVFSQQLSSIVIGHNTKN